MKVDHAIKRLLEPSVPEQVLTLPADLFFIELIEIPNELEDSELNDYSELTLESISPFPLDQLYWGYLSAKSAKRILLFAAHRQRVHERYTDPIESFAWVLPEFAPLAFTPFTKNTEVILSSPTGVSLLHFEQDNPIPLSLETLSCLPEKQADSIETLINNAPESAEGNVQLKFEATSISLSENCRPGFAFAIKGDATPEEEGRHALICPDENQLWTADLRSPEMKKSLRQARHLSRLCLRTLSWTALAGLLLLLGECLHFGGQTWLDSLRTRIAEQQPRVDTIAEQQSLMYKLEQIEQNDLQPIAILDALNKLRPRGIHFTKTQVEGENQVVIDGVANNVNALNSYTDALQKSGQFELLQSPKSITRQGKTTFTLQFAYSPSRKAKNAQNDA